MSSQPFPTWPDAHPELLPLLPLVLCAWEDGVLSEEEFGALSDRLDEQAWLDTDARKALEPWLREDHPPEAEAVTALRERLRESGIAHRDPRPGSLSDLGLALADAEGHRDLFGPEAVDGLRAVERAMGVVGAEAATRTLRAPAPAPPATDTASAPAPFDADRLHGWLDADRKELRAAVMELLAEPVMHIPEGTPYAEYRERALDAVQAIADRELGAMAYPEAYGGKNDPAGAIAVFETLAYGDLSVLIKYGVQFGLFGGSVLQLGTKRHHDRWLRDIGSMELPGCYAMTEGGHGSNVRDLETVTTYDPATDELVVTTPHEAAGKDWIGNAACHGRMATVFTRLVVDGEDHGVHAVLVPIRTDDGAPTEGVRIEDRGLKEGLNGVDNGRLWFDGVRVPRDNLLDRFAQIDPDGTYRSEIPSQGRRFFTMLGTLVAGRISIGAGAVSATKTGLTIAVRYGNRRRQFGPEGEPEVPVLDYLVHQRLLLPRLATTYGLHFALRDLMARYGSEEAADDPEIEVRAAGLKSYASWHCVDTLQACREACGGRGYLAANRFARLKADTDVFTTFEGANPVLMQLVAKGLLGRFKHEMGDLKVWGIVRYLAERAQTGVAELNPVITRKTDEEHLRDPDFHAAAFRYREDRLVRSAAMRLKDRLDDGVDSFQAMNEVQDHLVEMAEAHVERLILDAFQEGVAHAPTPGLSDAVGSLCALFALSTLERHRGWYLEAGYVEAAKSRAIRAQVNALCGEVREHAVVLVDGFGIPDVVLRAPAGLPE